MRRLKAREEALAEARRRREARTSPELPIEELNLNQRVLNLLDEEGIEQAGDVLSLMEERGDEGLTDIRGFGLKALADLKKAMRAQGFVLPGDEVEEEEPQEETEAEVA
jgi:DNA-directed RNA polymerase alpha subunit